MSKINISENKILNDEQRLAIDHGTGPLLIIAGAGTGKTTVITERIKYLISHELARPDEILALTFTEKATREMEERVDRALPYGISQMWISTFHSFCDRILRSEAINIGLDPAFKLMTEAENINYFRKNLFKFDLDYFRPLGNPTKFISALLTHFSRLEDENVTPEKYRQWVEAQTGKPTEKQTDISEEELAKYRELSGAFIKYRQLKIGDSVVDYADLITYTLQLFRTRKDVLFRYREQFKYILIDEFQDTNFAQNELAILLAGERQNITVVGDDDQAIYRWRGAAISNIIHFRKNFPQARVIVLTKNYRSTAEILNRSYQLIQYNNPDRLEVAEKIDKRLESMRRVNGEKIGVILSDRAENEADEVAKKIKALHEAKGEKAAKYDWNDFAILVRANNHSQPFTAALARHGIPYQFLGPGQLFRQSEVKDLIAYLKILYNFKDSVACYRVLTMEWMGLSARDLSILLSHSKSYGISLVESCELVAGEYTPPNMQPASVPQPAVSADGADKLTRFVKMVHRHLALVPKESAGQILYYFLSDSGLLLSLTSYKNTKEEKTALNIAKFFDKLKTYEVEHEDASVPTVVDYLDLSMTLGESPLAQDTDWTENDAVNILTIHSAKGLEFDVVFLVNLVSARFPTTERSEAIPLPDALIREILPTGDYHIEEERRLFYVGLTRARDRLFFTGAKFYGEGKREKKWSQFIPETMGEDFADHTPLLTASQQLSFLDYEPKAVSPERRVLHPVTYLSHSQLETFNTCPLQYRYKFLLRIPVPAKAALTFGDTIHRTLREFYDLRRAGDNPGLKELQGIYERNWVSAGYQDAVYEEKMKKQGEKILTEYFDKSYSPDVVPLATEKPFKIKISPKLSLGGKIDRVDRTPEGKLEIIDYKTGHPSTTRDPQKDQQLTVYALAATDPGLYGRKAEDVIVSFYYFDTQEKVSSTRTAEELQAARQKIDDTAREISQSTFPAKPGRQCDFCEFRLICEAWQ